MKIRQNCRTCNYLLIDEIGRMDIAKCQVYDDVKDISSNEVDCPRYSMAEMEVEDERQ